MGFSIRERAERIGGFRFVSVFLMETLASWVPTTPELEAKILFGRHVWDFAQHADQLGRRTGELRTAPQYSHPPTGAFRGLLNTVASPAGTVERVAGVYDAFLPDLERRYRAYVAATDPIADEPSIRIIERILNDFPRLRQQRDAFGAERPDLVATETRWADRLRQLLAAEAEVIEQGRLPLTAADPA